MAHQHMLCALCCAACGAWQCIGMKHCYVLPRLGPANSTRALVTHRRLGPRCQDVLQHTRHQRHALFCNGQLLLQVAAVLARQVLQQCPDTVS